jgi:mRNA interferase MazF
VLVAPITTVVRGIATEVPLGEAEGLQPGSVASLDNVQLVHLDCLLRRAGVVASDRWPEFCTAMAKVMAG